MMKKVVFLTGTRADFGKLKSLINICELSKYIEVYIFVTGMHLQKKYGSTVEEIEKSGFKRIYKFINHTNENTMEQTLAKTIDGFSSYIREVEPDLIVIHGDRVEALAGAITGALCNILVAHIEGGEVSGTIDELIRHAVSKMSHIHFVSNEIAKKRLIQMGELGDCIFIIGSPDVDIMLSNSLPKIDEAKRRYEIPFENYSILMIHPVTTELDYLPNHIKSVVDSLILSKQNLVVIYPNNDAGSSIIINEFNRFKNKENVRIFPSIRFEYFLVFLKNANFIIGNSSAGIREAPYYGVPTINIGSRQQNRSSHKDIINCDFNQEEISLAIKIALINKINKIEFFGAGKSDELFLKVISKTSFWKINKQKQFKDL